MRNSSAELQSTSNEISAKIKWELGIVTAFAAIGAVNTTIFFVRQLANGIRWAAGDSETAWTPTLIALAIISYSMYSLINKLSDSPTKNTSEKTTFLSPSKNGSSLFASNLFDEETVGRMKIIKNEVVERWANECVKEQEADETLANELIRELKK